MKKLHVATGGLENLDDDIQADLETLHQTFKDKETELHNSIFLSGRGCRLKQIMPSPYKFAKLELFDDDQTKFSQVGASVSVK